ncbi:aminoglycoside 3'-phosphotransferase [Senimuribacter intestinalis]|uniref:aminoglycoside 3'-phosphotransferase n=1 Tax=Senimuribacter intestinalis TaxID=2941507 RepID=UPI00203BBB01|nr:phosphotransferase [Senimuribacter intestinalis]
MKRNPIKLDIEVYPEAVTNYMKDAALYDSSCSPQAKVIFIDRDDGYFLKESAAGTLKTEAQMTAYMHSLKLSEEVLYYDTFHGKDYLLSRQVQGEDCTHPDYLSEPERLCDTMALQLRRLHETDGKGCPVQNRITTYMEVVKCGLDGKSFEPDLFKGIWQFDSFEDARRAAEEGMPLLKKEVLIHGDYCLPNIILNNWEFSGYIDLDCGGIGDRHIDVLWGIWTLNYNLGTAQYTERFIDGYGKDLIEPEKLRMIAAMEMIGG